MALAPARLDRFARQIVVPEIGGVGQAALAKRHVALVGLGGIGSPALQYLAAAGVGRLTLIDDGLVELSNLQRQTIYTERDIGHGKAVAARRWLANFDAELAIAISDARLTRDNAADLIAGVDLGASKGRSQLFAGICRASPAIAVLSAMRSMPTTATAAPRMACWGRWRAGPAPSLRCTPSRRCSKGSLCWAIRNGAGCR
jgi:hypothetical protein